MTISAQLPAPLDVAAVIDESRVKAFHVHVFLLCAACMILDGFDVQALGFVAPSIIQEWKIAPSFLGPVFGASNLGVLLGQLLFTLIADKIGRRPVLITGALLFGMFSLITGRVNSISELLVVRLFAGIALGSIIPNATALISEYSPRRLRVKLTTYIGVGYTLGAMIAGFVAAAIVPHFGWRSVFYLGGALPIVLAALMYLRLPESLRLLILRGKGVAAVARWLRQLDPQIHIAPDTRLLIHEESSQKAPVVQLFQDRRRLPTLLLWAVNFMNLLNLYSLSNWLPTVVRGTGYSNSQAVLIATMLQVGGTCAPFLMASLAVRVGALSTLTVAFAVACLTIAAVGHPGLPLLALLITVTVAGACTVGSQPSVNALSAGFYPTALRSTGIGWSLGIGRIGAIVGPVLAGQLIALHWSTESIFYVLAIPALLAMLAMLALKLVMKQRNSEAVAFG